MARKKISAKNTAEIILQSAGNWLDRDPGKALTTRVVCQIAGVTAPTLYHHFGSREGLLLALAERKMTAFLQHKKQHPEGHSPEAELLSGWNQWIDFAIKNPGVVAAIQSSHGASLRLRNQAEAIVLARLRRLEKHKPMTVTPCRAAQSIVAASNVIVQLLQQGMPVKQAKAISHVLQRTMLNLLTADGSNARNRKRHRDTRIRMHDAE
jgi:AcrR family transcriptional regulator